MGHQAFFTEEAQDNIAQTTLENMNAIEKGRICSNQITQELALKA
jgi:D-lactate dehydrogenase